MSFISYVDPFIGVDGGGNVLCGPYLPYGLVRLGPDTVSPDLRQTNGYQSDLPIKHFSHTHVSGTGGGSRYGNIGIIPFTGPLRTNPGSFEKEAEDAAAGHYAVTLHPGGVRAELTVTPRVGLHRYTFPAGAPANVFVDVGAVLQMAGMVPGPRHEEGTGACIGGYVESTSDREVVGRGDFRGGWGHNFPYSVFFCARFDRPFVASKVGNHHGVIAGTHADEANCFAALNFGNIEHLHVRVGISHVSVAKARASVDRETARKEFDDIRKEAEQIWERALSRIRVEGGTDVQRTLFYTQFTRLICMPTDLGVDDEFPLWHSGVRHFTDFYTIWDSVRNANALLTLFDPTMEIDQLNCLLDIADHVGWLPDVWIQGHSGMIQGGSSADVLLCEAALKGLEGIDYEKALRHTRKNNEVESPNPYLYGRYLKDYRDLGYLTTNVRKNCVSRHLEYAYQDWCIGTLAAHLGYEDVAAQYHESSRKVWNLWRDDLQCFAPRQPDGAWVDPFDQDSCWDDSWNDPFFYEGTSRQWSFNVQHDFAELINRHGGPEGFIAHLDHFFDNGHYHSKETMLHIPWLYTYAGRPDRTAERVRACMEKYFRPTRDGLSDNEDMGCQSAFYMCAAMGMYPIMGQDIYLIATPVFEHVEVQLGQHDKTLIIEAPGASPDRSYIAAATLNGSPLDRAWLRHSEIARGATLHFQLTDHPTRWGCDTPPPSPLA
jgi:predicted alpha-1,2-mannosidase